MKILIENLKPHDEKKFFDFIKRQDKSDLILFTRWRNYSSSEKLLKKFVYEECNKKEEEGVRIIAKSIDGQIHGFGLIDFFNEPIKKHVAIVGTIVDKNNRGHGIGKQLLEKELEIGRKYNKKKLRATIHEHNVESMKLHLSVDFKVEGRFVAEEFDGKYRNVISLALFLEPVDI